MTRRWRKPSGRRMRREPEEMGLTLAFPAAVPQATDSDDPAAEPLRAETTDGELIQRVGRGDAGAFEVLYRRFLLPEFWLEPLLLGAWYVAVEQAHESVREH